MPICRLCLKRVKPLYDEHCYACNTKYMTVKEQRAYDEELRKAAQSAADGAPAADGTGGTDPHRKREQFKYRFNPWDFPWT